MGQTARRYTFYNAALVWLQFRYDGKGTAGKQAATQVELHFSAATIELDGIRLDAYSVIPWEADAATSFRALSKPPAPRPSAHLAAGMGVVSGRLAEAAAGVLKKALPIAGEGVARTLSLLPGLLLASVNADADPAKDADWQLYHRNHAQLRLNQLERLHEQGALTPEEEAEYRVLLAKLKGIHDTTTPLIGSGPQHGIIEVSNRVKSIKAFKNFKPKAPVDFVYDPSTNRLVVATARTVRNGHPGLVSSLGAAERDIVGGRLRRGPNGELETSEWSGHYGDQWTPAIRIQFKDFMLRQTGEPVNHSSGVHFPDGSN